MGTMYIDFRVPEYMRVEPVVLPTAFAMPSMTLICPTRDSAALLAPTRFTLTQCNPRYQFIARRMSPHSSVRAAQAPDPGWRPPQSTPGSGCPADKSCLNHQMTADNARARLPSSNDNAPRYSTPPPEDAREQPAMGYDWAGHRATCYRLYIEEGRPLEEIMQHLRAKRGFSPR